MKLKDVNFGEKIVQSTHTITLWFLSYWPQNQAKQPTENMFKPKEERKSDSKLKVVANEWG